MQNVRLSRAVVILISSPSLMRDRSIELQTALSYVSVQNTIRCLSWAGKHHSLHDVEFDKSTGWVLGIHEAKKNFSLYTIDF